MAALPVEALAHASEQGLVMLLPTGLYTLSGTLAVAASILLMAFLPVKALEGVFQSRKFGTDWVIKRIESTATAFAFVVFLGLILIGFNGPNDPQSNLLPLFIWTGWWIGVFVIQGTIFDIWRLINPWTGMVRVLSLESSALFNLPKRMGHWPAVLVFFSFQLFLLADIAPNDPDRLATFVLGYWLFTFGGIVLFGADQWLNRIECFTVVFRLIGSLRALQTENEYRSGVPGWSSIAAAPLDTSRAVLCLMILISGSFDGLHETFWWLGKIGINPLEFPGRSAVVWSSSLGLLCANILGVSVYGLVVWVGLVLVREFGNVQNIRLMDAFNTFAVAILPIALGYHFAHYLISFLVQVQYLAATIADPLAKGWNLFGLGRLTVTVGFLNSMESVRPILLTNVFAIILSHVLSVIMAHRLAARFCNTRRGLLLIQCGLSLLMIVYTIFGLWLLSTPRGA
ncbi:MAG: hypothetical protein P8O08_08795 [Paracoccaceae bacterium]|nr:hypothetical protein [Paracoccaceae bacterium]